MDWWEYFDVSSARPMSSDSIKARFDLMEVEHSHSFASNYKNYGTGNQNREALPATQNDGAERDVNASHFLFLSILRDPSMLDYAHTH